LPGVRVVSAQAAVRNPAAAADRLQGIVLDVNYRLDLVVEDVVVVEVKSVAAIASVHEAQLLTYLGLSGCPAGLLINFNVPRLVSGVKRLINQF
jgi:GxxExxY protein